VTRIRTPLLLLLLLPAGCRRENPAVEQIEQAQFPRTSRLFDPETAGRVTGRVSWSGSIPNPHGFLYGVPRPDGLGFAFRTAANPNRPLIDPNSRAVVGAVVLLRGVDSTAGRPWDLPAAQVEIGNGQITVIQGERRGRVGFVHRGDVVTVASTEPTHQVLRGRGDGFFSLALPEPDRPVTRNLSTPGRIELSSGTGLYWARADLFVTDHPYFTLTDADGRFTLERVPHGAAELVVWLPGWDVANQERDPDSTGTARQTYSAPIERAEWVTVGRAASAEVNVSLP